MLLQLGRVVPMRKTHCWFSLEVAQILSCFDPFSGIYIHGKIIFKVSHGHPNWTAWNVCIVLYVLLSEISGFQFS